MSQQPLKDNADVLVLGAGIIGICCALALQKKGHTVTIIDPEAPGSQTSSGNAGGIAVTEVIPLSMPGVLRSAPQWLLDPAGPLSIRWQHIPSLLPWFWRFIEAGSQQNVARIVPVLASLLRTVYQDFEPLLQEAGIAGQLHKQGSITLYQNRSTYNRAALEWDLKREQGVRFETLSPAEIHDLEPALVQGNGTLFV